MPVPPSVAPFADRAIEVVPTLEGLRIVSFCGWVTVCGLVLIIAWLADKVQYGCPDCSHCRARNRARDKDGAARRNGSSEEAQRERLFGVRRDEGPVEEEAPPEEGPPGIPERDEGRAGEER